MTETHLPNMFNKCVVIKTNVHNFRRSRPDRPGVCQGQEGVRPRAGRVQVWPGGPRRAGPHIQKGPVPRRRTDLPGDQHDEAATYPAAGATGPQAGGSRTSLLLRAAPPLPRVRHAAARARGDRQALWGGLRAQSVRC